MTTDEFFAVISQKIDDKIQKNSHLKMLKNKIEKGNADFRDTFEYNNIVNETMGEFLADVILSVPERQKLAEKLLGKRYSETNDMLSDVQLNLDKKTGLNIQPKKAPYPDERITKVAHSLEDKTIPDEKIQRRARNSVPNVANSFHDDYMKENASLRTDAGIKCYIERDTDGNCCPWCTRISGKYEYVSAPDDIFKRHDNCSCTCTYINGRTRQDVWSKKKWQTNSKFKPKVLSRLEAKKNEMENLQRGLTNSNNNANIIINNTEYLKRFYSELQKMNISFSGFENYQGDTKVLDEALKSLEKMKQEFPKLFKGFGLKYELYEGFDENVYAGYTAEENAFYFNPLMYNDTKKLVNNYAEDVMKSFHPERTDYRANVFHEFGHYVETIADIKTKKIAKELYQETHNNWFNRKQGDFWISTNLCRYASLYDYGELIAESFAEYYGSETPRELCKLVVEKVMKILKEKGMV